MEKTKITIALIACAAFIIIGLGACNFFFVAGYGSFSGFLAEMRSLPDDEKLETLRSDAVMRLTQSHTELNSVAGLTLYEKTDYDGCIKGKHTWMRDESYAYICSYRMTYYYGTDREYEELLLDIERALNDLGWTVRNQNPKQPTISEAVAGYSGETYLVELPLYLKQISDSNTVEEGCFLTPCYNISLTINGFSGYSGNWTNLSEEIKPYGFGVGIGQEVYSNKPNKPPEEIFNETTSSGQYPIMIAISEVYFRN